MLLDAGDVGADRDVATVLGAPLADMQPAAVFELGLEGAGTGRRRAAFLHAGADLRHAADLDHGLIGRAGDDGGLRQLVQTLEVRIAEHQTVARIPEHERLRDGLDGIAQPQVGFDAALGEALLLGDVDGDADQVQPGVVRAVAQLAAHPEPDPVAVDMLHAKRLVDVIDLAGDKLVGDGEQIDVIAFHQRVDLAEGQEVAAGLQPEQGEHRVRPEDAAAVEVPVPQAAAAAVERGIDAAAHGVVDEVALAGAGGLPVEGKAEDQHHEAGGGGQRHRQRRVRAPDRLQPFLDHDDPALQGLDELRGRHGAVAVRQRHVGDLALQAGRGNQLRRADRVENAVGLVEIRFDRKPRQDAGGRAQPR